MYRIAIWSLLKMNSTKIGQRVSLGNFFQFYKHTSLTNNISTTPKNDKIVPKNMKKLKKSSQDWLTRHLNDPYVKLCKIEMYRARSAFKLLEIDEQCKILKPGQIVVECGAAPGAWTQVIIPKINSLFQDETKSVGKVIAIDKLQFAPLDGCEMLTGHDFTSEKTQRLVLQLLDNQKVDCVLSDMAPNATGTKDMDHELIVQLVYSALKFAISNTKKNGTFLCKIWEGHRGKQLKEDLLKYYEHVKLVKPNASRLESPELFYVAKKFKGL